MVVRLVTAGLLAGLMLLALPASAQVSSSIPEVLRVPGDLERPTWKAFPDFNDHYVLPQERSDGEDLEYTIIVRCRIITAAGRLSCFLVAEDPAGFGVGRRTADVLTQYGVIDMSPGKGARVGSVFNQVVRFEIED